MVSANSRKALLARHPAAGDHRIEAARQQQDGDRR
jgi:hypothetical protein